MVYPLTFNFASPNLKEESVTRPFASQGGSVSPLPYTSRYGRIYTWKAPPRSGVDRIMSTKCKHTLKSAHEYNQCLSEIEWTKNKIKEVELQMQKRPSKVRHRNDLLRQLQERLDLIHEFDSRN